MRETPPGAPVGLASGREGAPSPSAPKASENTSRSVEEKPSGLDVAVPPANSSSDDSDRLITGAFLVVGDPSDYSFEGGVLTVKGPGRLTISNEDQDAPTTDRILIAPGVTANVELTGVNIDVSARNYVGALKVPAGATLNLSLAKGSENLLRSGRDHAGLEVPTGATLTIGGSGGLSATGGRSGAGIGGGNRATGGTITVSGGIVSATGGAWGAGIGGGSWCSGATVSILGGTVRATGGDYGAGIGGGYNGGGGATTVSGGNVSAIGGFDGAGIGGGTGGSSGSFETTFSGNAFLIASSIADTSSQGTWSAVVFEGDAGQVYGSPTLMLDATISAGKTLAVPTGSTLAVASGATLTNDGAIENRGSLVNRSAIKGDGVIRDYAGDLVVTGSTLDGDYSYDVAAHVLTVRTGTPLTISGTTEADWILIAPGVTANVELAGVNIDVSEAEEACALEVSSGAILDLSLAEGSESFLKSGQYRAGLEVGDGASLVLEGLGSLSATGGYWGAGIGGGDDGDGSSISVLGGTVSATGGSGGAGIGGGINGDGGSISVLGGTVSATGIDWGAGIGGGSGGSGGTISVTGGTVSATGGSRGYDGAGIGGGAGGSPGTFKTTPSGSAFVLASSIADTTDKKQWSGIVFDGCVGEVYGKPTLALDATVPAGKTLTVPADSPLSLGDGVTLTNEGTIVNHGGIAGSNSLAGNGTTVSDSQVVLTAVPSPVPYNSEVTLTAKVFQEAKMPGENMAKPSGTVDFGIGSDDGAVSLGEPVALAPDPADPGASLATLKVKASGDGWAIGINDVKASYSGQNAAPNTSGLSQADGHLSLSVGKVSIHPSVSIEGWIYGQEASSPSVDPATNPGGGAISYEYKTQGAPDSAYKADIPTEAGDYTLRAKVGETDRCASGEATADFAIAKAAQAAPSPNARAEAVSGKGDGAIVGLTAAMEWATSGGGYQPVKDPSMAFKPGTYRVRLAADENHDASPASEVVVAQGPKLKVALPAGQVGYTLTADKTALDWHESSTLAFKLVPGYAKTAGFAVKATGAAISPGPDGTYILSDAEGDVAVAVEGVAPEFTQQTVYDGSHDVSLSGTLTSGARFVVTSLPSGDASFDVLSQMALAAGQDVMGAYEAKLIGRYEGKLRISFEVGEAYEGKTLMVYHQKDAGGIEELRSVVEDGWASVEVDGLSPFLVAVPSTLGEPAPRPVSPDSGGTLGAPGGQPGTSAGGQGAATLAPQTGDGLPLVPLALVVLLSVASLAALGAREARRRRRGGR